MPGSGFRLRPVFVRNLGGLFYLTFCWGHFRHTNIDGRVQGQPPPYSSSPASADLQLKVNLIPSPPAPSPSHIIMRQIPDILPFQSQIIHHASAKGKGTGFIFKNP